MMYGDVFAFAKNVVIPSVPGSGKPTAHHPVHRNIGRENGDKRIVFGSRQHDGQPTNESRSNARADRQDKHSLQIDSG